MTNHLERLYLDFERRVVSSEMTEEERGELYGAFVAGVHSFLAELLDQGDAGTSDSFLDDTNDELDAFTKRLRQQRAGTYPPAPARA